MSSSISDDSTPAPALELEQKFEIHPDTPRLLEDLGFKKVKEFSMADWYFDAFDPQQAPQSSSFPLVRRDTWLRYREMLVSNGQASNKGRWELKLGTAGMNQKGAQKKTTAYKEFIGNDAFEALDALDLPIYDNVPTGEDEEYQGLVLPQLPKKAHLGGMAPFARIVTHRSSWKKKRESTTDDKSVQSQVSVDLDTTDFHYNVGEAEIVVTPTGEDWEETVAKSSEIIQDWIDKLSNDGAEASKGPTLGKLEYYLQTQKPDIFAILREANLVA